MFEEWVTDNPFIISPRITFEVSVRLLGGLMALGYTIATILKRNSHIFSDDKVCVKLDWLEQLNRCYVQVQGRDRSIVKHVAEKLGLEGSYVPRTYIEQIQLEKLINEIMTLPEDLKTKLSIDDDLVSSPKEALSRASADRVAMRAKQTKREKNIRKLARLSLSTRRFDSRTLDSPATAMPLNQGVITQLSEQISTLNERMDEFTSHVEEMNSKFNNQKPCTSQQNLALQSDICYGTAPTTVFMSGMGNGILTASLIPHSSSSTQLAKDTSLLDEIMTISRSQRQIMHQLDNLSNLLRGNLGEVIKQRTESKTKAFEVSSIGSSLVLLLALGGMSLLLFKSHQMV